MEIVRNSLYKYYLEDFDRYCTEEIGGITGAVMTNLLAFEADRRTINITINSLGTELQKEDRLNLYPKLGLLYPHAFRALSEVQEIDDIPKILTEFLDNKEYANIIRSVTSSVDGRTLEDNFFDFEVRQHQIVFEQQFNYGLFYAYFKLKEQEIRNILWISECILQNHKAEINNYIRLELEIQ